MLPCSQKWPPRRQGNHLGGSRVQHKSCNPLGWAATPNKNYTAFYPKSVKNLGFYLFLPQFFIAIFLHNWHPRTGAPVSHRAGPAAVRDNSALTGHHMYPTDLFVLTMSQCPPGKGTLVRDYSPLPRIDTLVTKNL